jgi:hypothetical protein
MFEKQLAVFEGKTVRAITSIPLMADGTGPQRLTITFTDGSVLWTTVDAHLIYGDTADGTFELYPNGSLFPLRQT